MSKALAINDVVRASLFRRYGIPVFIPNIYQVVSFDATQQSAAFNAATRLIELSANQDCWIKIGSNPTADTTTSKFLAKGTIVYYEVTPGHKIAAIKDSAAGKLSVLELTI